MEISPAVRLPWGEEPELPTKVIRELSDKAVPSIPMRVLVIVKFEIVMLLIFSTFVVKTTMSPEPTELSLSFTISEWVVMSRIVLWDHEKLIKENMKKKEIYILSILTFYCLIQ